MAGRRTSVALEEEFWAALKHIAASHQETLTALVAEADARRPEGAAISIGTAGARATGVSSHNPSAHMHAIDIDDAQW